jgi:H+-transporting ATPase
MDMFCVDKTGTITMYQLAVTGVIPRDHWTESDLQLAGALASRQANQDPIALAFLEPTKALRKKLQWIRKLLAK